MRKNLTISLMLAMSMSTFVSKAQLTDQDLQVGDTVEFEGKKWLMGANIIKNPSFSNITDAGEIENWTVGGYTQMTTATFQWHSTGGYDGGAYIQATGGDVATGKRSIVQRWEIDPGNKYYMSFWMKDNIKDNQYAPVISLTSVLSTNGGQNELEGTDKKGNVHHGKTLLGKNGDDPSSTSYGFANCIDNGKTWAQTRFFFDSEEYKYLQCNARWLSNSSFDGFYLARLYDPETTSALDLIKIQIKTTAMTLLDYADNFLGEYPGIGNLLYDLAMLYGEGYEPVDEVEAREALVEMQNALKDAQVALVSAEELNYELKLVENILSAQETYPGYDILMETFDEISGNIDPASWIPEDYINALERIKTAVNEYYLSQIPSMDNPANYTFMMSSPHFCNRDAEPKIYDGIFEYPYGANYSNDVKPSDANTSGWFRGSNTSGDQRVTYAQQRIAWKAYNKSFDEISINQELSGLPSGYYSVSADLITESGCVTDQHVYGRSSMGESLSPSLDPANISFVSESPYNGTWERLTTPCFVVIDGKATIGASAHGDKMTTPAENGGTQTDYRRGWFLVTNFRLNYHGPLSDSDLNEAYSKRIAELQAQCDTMLFKADRKAFQDSINKYSRVSTVEEMKEYLDILSNAQSAASKSISKQVSILNGITFALEDSINAGSYVGDVASMAKNFHDLMLSEIHADDATYIEMDSLVQILYRFRDTYVPKYLEASAFSVSDITAKSVLESNIERHVAYFCGMQTLPEEKIVAKYADELDTAMSECRAIDLFNMGSKDYTSLIVNPGIDHTSLYSEPKGWNIHVVKGNTHVGAGCQVDGDKQGHYLDSYNSSKGALRYNAYQTISSVPNGRYELKAMVRTTSDRGVYLYAFADNDSTTMVLQPVERERINITELGGPTNSAGGDSIETVTNKYGSIFVDLYHRTNGGATANDLESDTLGANGFKGYGWFYKSLEIEVKNHSITFGYTCDSVFTSKFGGVPFEGTWLSADNFSLRLIEAGDNSGWNPATRLNETVKDQFPVKVVDGVIVTDGEIYGINGMRIANGTKVPKGIYIVRLGNVARKVIVR